MLLVRYLLVPITIAMLICDAFYSLFLMYIEEVTINVISLLNAECDFYFCFLICCLVRTNCYVRVSETMSLFYITLFSEVSCIVM